MHLLTCSHGILKKLFTYPLAQGYLDYSRNEICACFFTDMAKAINRKLITAFSFQAFSVMLDSLYDFIILLTI